MNIIRMKIYSKRLGITLLLLGVTFALLFASEILSHFFPIMILSLGAITALATLHDEEIIWPLKIVVIALDVLGVFKVLHCFHSLP